MRWVWTVALVVGCAKEPAASQESTVEAPISADTPSAEKTPQGLYEQCRDRVEEPQKSGECSVDADCARTGCGAEVCTTAAAAKDVMSTCEVRPCFSVLDTCGCHEGVCDWTLKAEIPPRKMGPPAGGLN